MDPDDLDIVFHALAHRDRRRILALVREAPGSRVEDVAGRFETSRIAVMKHLRVLETAGLIHSEKVGRERRMYFNPVPIRLIYEACTNEFAREVASEMTRIKAAVEAGEMAKKAKGRARKRNA
ncbi:MAG: helix-turn-helix domain-containing protein [Isosphaeraceae bacterium]